MKTYILVILLFGIVIIMGCKDESTSSSNEYNSVSIRSVNDTLAINISTTNHTYSNTTQLVFSVDTVNISMVVSGYGSGDGQFRILHDTNAVYTKALNSNYQISERVYTGIPTSAAVTLTNYKGTVNILVTR